MSSSWSDFGTDTAQGSITSGINLGMTQLNNTFNGMRNWYYSKKASRRQYNLATQYADYVSALQYDYWQKQLQNQPSLYRQGLEKAGFNPLLAVSGAAGSVGGISPSGYGASVDSPAPSSSYDGLHYVKRMQELEREATETTIDGIKKENDIKTEQKEKIKAETNKIKRETVTGAVRDILAPLATASATAYGIKKYVDAKNAKALASKIVDLPLKHVGSAGKAVSIGSKFLGALGLGLSAYQFGKWATEKHKEGKEFSDYHRGREGKTFSPFIKH